MTGSFFKRLSPERSDMELTQIKPLLLEKHVGSGFEVQDDLSNVFSLTLTEVAGHVRTERNEAFSLLFHGPLDRFLKQGIHKLKHPELGEMEIFLVPIAQDKEGFQYEAAFNQML
jgi:hypothetical protein